MMKRIASDIAFIHFCTPEAEYYIYAETPAVCASYACNETSFTTLK